MTRPHLLTRGKPMAIDLHGIDGYWVEPTFLKRAWKLVITYHDGRSFEWVCKEWDWAQKEFEDLHKAVCNYPRVRND